MPKRLAFCLNVLRLFFKSRYLLMSIFFLMFSINCYSQKNKNKKVKNAIDASVVKLSNCFSAEMSFSIRQKSYYGHLLTQEASLLYSVGLKSKEWRNNNVDFILNVNDYVYLHYDSIEHEIGQKSKTIKIKHRPWRQVYSSFYFYNPIVITSRGLFIKEFLRKGKKKEIKLNIVIR